MSKTKNAPTPIASASEIADMDVNVDLGNIKVPEKTSVEKLNEVLATLPVENLGDGIDLTAGGKIKSTTVVINEPNMPSAESLGLAATTSVANAAKATSSLSLDPNISSVLSALADAPKFREKANTKPTQAIIEDKLVQIPASVRDLPANLYMDSNGNYVRGEADQILQALFGDVASLANMWACKRGFAHKPLVWLSQMIYRYVELDKQIDFKSPIKYQRPVYEGKDSRHTESIHYVPSIQFNPEIDDKDESPLLTNLRRWLYHLTVRNMVRIGKEHNLSIVEVLRCIIGQYDRDFQPKPTVTIR